MLFREMEKRLGLYGIEEMKSTLRIIFIAFSHSDQKGRFLSINSLGTGRVLTTITTFGER